MHASSFAVRCSCGTVRFFSFFSLRRRGECCDDEANVATTRRVFLLCVVFFFVVRRLGPPAVEVHHVYQFNVFSFHLSVLGLYLLFAVF
jgi:hypothetical protein